MTFRLHIDIDNEAFQPLPYPELARLLRGIAARLEFVERKREARKNEPAHAGDEYQLGGGWTGHYQTIRDINGNDVGRYAIKRDGE